MPFKPGQSGNPHGRAKGRIEIGTHLRNWLKQKAGTQTNLQKVINKLAEEDPKVLLYYAFGKPVETHNVEAAVTVTGIPENVLDGLRKLAATAFRPK